MFNSVAETSFHSSLFAFNCIKLAVSSLDTAGSYIYY